MLKNKIINHEPGFILTTRPWKESSLVLEIFTKHYGRKTLIARSARKPNSELRGILNPFIPILFSWYGQNDLLTLHKAKWIGGYSIPLGISSLSAWYINELIFKLVSLDDPHPKLFDFLKSTMQSITKKNVASELRKFEWKLLSELGFAPSIEHDIYHQPINVQKFYIMRYEHNPIPINKTEQTSQGVIISGKSLINITQEDYSLEQTQQEAKVFFQFLLEYYIPHHQIISSIILKQLLQLSFK